MIRSLCTALAVTAVACLALFPSGAASQGKEWGTVKGRVVWGGKDIPERPKLKITVDQMHCLEKGDLLDDQLVVNPKNKGLKNAFVWVAQSPDEADTPLPIHPSLKDVKDKTVVLDQPRCMFFPRAVAIREGQELLVKNSAPVNHNIQWLGDTDINVGGNVTLPPGKEHAIKDLKPQRLPLILQCNIHGWMRGRLAVFSHPYFAVTDDNGNFEIKMAPAGNYRLVVYHEAIGWRGGAKGRAGQEITIKPGTTDLSELPTGGAK